MKTVKIKSNEVLSSELKESWRLEEKLLKTNDPLSEKEIRFLKARAEEGVPLGEFSYGLYYLLHLNDEKTAEEWWNKFFYHSNGEALWKASGIFSFLGDEYYDWSMKCLKRAAWRQHPIAKAMYKEMKQNPFKFPEA